MAAVELTGMKQRILAAELANCHLHLPYDATIGVTEVPD
jgi:hypothetical protein